jgi:hypothetical protein
MIINTNLIPKKIKESDNFVYFLRIGKWYKIGTTNNPLRRFKELNRYYKTDIEILFISKPYAKYTTLRVEEDFINRYKKRDEMEYIRNDRFIIKSKIPIHIKVKKEWEILY